MVTIWVFLLALSIPLYVPLDDLDLGVGILFGSRPDEQGRRAMMKRGCADLGRQRDLARGLRRGAVGRLSNRVCDAAVRLLSSPYPHACRPDLARRGLRVSFEDGAFALDLGCGIFRRFARRCFHAGSDRGRPGGGLTVLRRPLHRRGTPRSSAPLRSCAGWDSALVTRFSGAWLACPEVRNRNEREGSSPDPRSLSRSSPSCSLSSYTLRRSTFRSWGDGSSGPICSSSPRLVPPPRSLWPSGCAPGETDRHFIWSPSSLQKPRSRPRSRSRPWPYMQSCSRSLSSRRPRPIRASPSCSGAKGWSSSPSCSSTP